MIKTLKFIAEQYGNDILRDGSKLIAYYSDIAPRQKTERQMLEFLIKCNGNNKLLNVCQETQQEQQACVDTLVKQLTSQLLMSEDAAYTVCDNFLQAIGGASIKIPKAIQHTTPKKTSAPPIDEPQDQSNNSYPIVQNTNKATTLKIIVGILLIVGIALITALVIGFLKNSGSDANTNQNSSTPPEHQKVISQITIRGSEYSRAFIQLDYTSDGLIRTICISGDDSINTINYNYNNDNQLVNAEGYYEAAKGYGYSYSFEYNNGKLMNWKYAGKKDSDVYSVKYGDQNLISQIFRTSYWLDEKDSSFTLDYYYRDGKVDKVISSPDNSDYEMVTTYYQYNPDGTILADGISYSREYPWLVMGMDADNHLVSLCFDTGYLGINDIHVLDLCREVFFVNILSGTYTIENTSVDDTGHLSSLELIEENGESTLIWVTYEDS